MICGIKGFWDNHMVICGSDFLRAKAHPSLYDNSSEYIGESSDTKLRSNM
ncbi:MAG: hypothetical protein QMD02_03670 [Bacteroidales bacterium]|nr:hypothetical protein [Bacteroidales bacterium]